MDYSTSINSISSDARETVLPERDEVLIELDRLDRAGNTLRRREADDLLKQGLVHYYDRELPKALTFLKQAQAIYWELGDPEGSQKALTKLGLACYGLGDYGAAIDYSQRALVWAENWAIRPLSFACSAPWAMPTVT
ncbi:MAG: tetratricopeptide repeat protein [Alkalinema sp. RU_4_3]|nr:tetratricopeptide repeat protein [Alkalinema sp. RU_4_3]